MIDGKKDRKSETRERRRGLDKGKYGNKERKREGRDRG